MKNEKYEKSPGFRSYEPDNKADPRVLGEQLASVIDRKFREGADIGIARRAGNAPVLGLASVGESGRLTGESVFIIHDEPTDEMPADMYTVTRYVGGEADGSIGRTFDKIIFTPGEHPVREDFKTDASRRYPATALTLQAFLEVVDNGLPYDPNKQRIVNGRIVKHKSLRAMGAVIRGFVVDGIDPRG